MLPTPRNPSGYTAEEIRKICVKRRIKFSDFDKAFGINTCMLAPNGDTIFFTCDVERALYRLKQKDGKNFWWD